MRKADLELLRVFNGRACELCGAPPLSDPHHVYAKGHGGGSRLDKCLNLVSLCRSCHDQVHAGHVQRVRLWQLVEEREGLEPGQAMQAVHTLLRRPKP